MAARERSIILDVQKWEVEVGVVVKTVIVEFNSDHEKFLFFSLWLIKILDCGESDLSYLFPWGKQGMLQIDEFYPFEMVVKKQNAPTSKSLHALIWIECNKLEVAQCKQNLSPAYKAFEYGKRMLFKFTVKSSILPGRKYLMKCVIRLLLQMLKI